MVRAKVTNYQRVREADITIKGLTLLKGSSNGGKSSYFGAIQAACSNRFRTGCVTFGEKQADIIIQYSDSPLVFKCTRLAKGGSPIMALGNKSVGYQTFSVLNRTVPDEVKSYHNFGKIKVSTSEEVDINFVSQFEPPLLVNFTPRKIVDILAASEEMTKLFRAKRILDSNNLDLKGSFKTLTTLVSESKDNIHRTTQAIKKLPPKDALLISKREIEARLQRLVQLDVLQSGLRELNSKYCNYQRVSSIVSSTSDFLQLRERYSSLMRIKTMWDILRYKERSKRFADRMVELSTVNDSVLQLSTKLNTFTVLSKRRTFAASMVFETGIALRMSDELNSLKELSGKLLVYKRKQSYLQRVQMLTTELQATIVINSRLQSLRNLLESLPRLTAKVSQLESLRQSQLNNECPFCGNIIDGADHKH